MAESIVFVQECTAPRDEAETAAMTDAATEHAKKIFLLVQQSKHVF